MGCGGSRSLPPAKDPLTLYIWPGSAPCRAVMMAARAANIDVTLVNVNVMKGEHRNDDFKKMSPDLTVPVLKDKKADREIANSHEIMPYLLDVYAPDHLVYPADPARRHAIDKWLKYDQDIVYKAVINWVYPQIFLNKPADDDLFQCVKEVLDHLDNNLDTSTPYLAYRSVSIADLATAANLSLLELVYFEAIKWKNVWAWLQRIKGLPYYAPCNKGLENWKMALYVKQQEKEEKRKKAVKSEE